MLLKTTKPSDETIEKETQSIADPAPISSKPIDAWVADHVLQLVRYKPEAIKLTKKWAYRDPGFRCS